MCNVHLILTLTPPWLQVKVTKYFDFVNLDVWRVVVCARFSETTWPNYPMLMPIYRGNNVDLQHILQYDIHPSMTAGQFTIYFDFVNFDVWWVVVCVRFSSETTQPISPMLLPIYRVNNVDLQHIHHFDLNPSMTAGHSHKILKFCEFRLLPWHECWYMSGPYNMYKVAGDRLDLVVHMFPVWWCLHDTLVPLGSIYASTWPPKNGNISIFYMLLRR